MSIEYFAQTDFSISKSHIARIRERLNNNPTVELLDNQMDSSIVLRFVDIPKRETWPEDATIAFESHSVCLSFHSSLVDIRESFVKEMTGLLANMGIPCEFEED